MKDSNQAWELESLDSAGQKGWGGQGMRQTLFTDLVSRLGVASIVETGTFRGSSMASMAAQSGLPLFSCEADPHHFHDASRRLAGFPNVTLTLQDPRSFLRQLLDSGTLPPGPVLFHLDAHRPDDLPVWEEIDIVFSRNVPAVVVIDGFRVPGDTGSACGDRGVDKRVSVQDLRRNVASETEWFFPHGSSAAEHDRTRSCAVLARGEQAERIARDVPGLDRLDWRTAVLLDAVTAEMPALQAANARLQADNAQLRIAEVALRTEGERQALQLRTEAARVEVHLRAEAARLELQVRTLDNSVRERDQKIAALEQAIAQKQEMFAALLEEGRQRLQEFESRVKELQSSRWRRIGRRLRLIRPATFEG